MFIKRIYLFFTSFLICIFFVSANITLVRAETSHYRSAGWVATDGNPPFEIITGCQVSNDGSYCSRVNASSQGRLYFSSFGNLEAFGIPQGSYVTKLHIRVTGNGNSRYLVGVEANKNKMPFTSSCQLPTDLWNANLSLLDVSREFHTFISGNSLTNCITANNVDLEKLTFVFGGSTPNSWYANIDNFEVAFDYFPSTHLWQNKGLLNKGRFLHTATLLDNGKVLVVGGESNGLGVNQTETYNPSTRTWTLVNSPNDRRRLHTANLVVTNTSTGSTNVLVAGGHELFGDGPLNSAELYNPDTNTWVLTPFMNSTRYNHASSLLPDGQVFVTGGDNGTNNGNNILSSTEVYDPIVNTWTFKAPMSIARRNHAQASFIDVQGKKKIMVIGGSNVISLKSTEVYDPENDTWGAGPDMNFARAAGKVIVLHDGRILVAGTDNPNSLISEVYNPVTNSWMTYNMIYPFSSSGELALLNSEGGYKVLAAGGSSTLSNEAQLFDPATNTWTATAFMNAARGRFTLTTLMDGSVIAASGLTAGVGQTNLSEVYTPPSVLGASTAPTPSPSPMLTATPTQIPTPTVTPTPVPFLDLPFDYGDKNFDYVALNPNSWFDHAYPLGDLLCCIQSIVKYNSLGERVAKAYKHHNGYDYGVNNGSEVLAAASGFASYTPNVGAYGNLVKITHTNGYQTWYAHLQPQSQPTSGFVNKGEKIGLVGTSGNSTGPHIHFTVLKDSNSNNNFEDDVPVGFVDPLGWEGSGTDPWTEYTHANGRNGTESFNLFIPRELPVNDPVPTTGAEVSTNKVKVTVPPGAAIQFFTLSVKNSSFEKKDNKIVSAAPSFFLNAVNSLGDVIRQFFAPITIEYDYSDADLANILEDTLKLYWFNEEIKDWQELPSTLDKENKTVTAQTSHFSQFALMGEVKDAVAPETEVVIHGQQGDPGWYSSSVNVELIAEDNEGGLGVLYTLYKVDEDEWDEYTEPIVITQEGEHTITYQSEDIVDNIEDQKVTSFTIDKTQPITILEVVNGTIGADGWYTSDVTVSLEAQDSHSGVAKTEYSLDEGLTYDEYQNNVVVSSEGDKHIYYRSRDKAGNIEDAKDILLKIDKTAPNSRVYTTGASGSEDWYRSNVEVSLNAGDDLSGYKTSYYSFNDDENYTEYSEPLVINEEGITKINYYSVDNAGNVEESNSLEIKIDKTAPEAKIEYDLEEEDLMISGTDDQDMVTETKLKKNRQSVTIKDKAGNTLVLDGIERDRKSNAVIKLFTLSYNGEVTTLDRNRIAIQYKVDKKGKIKTFKQVYNVHEGERIKLEYNTIKDKTIITQNKQKIEVPGVKFLQLTTEKGQIKYIY